MGNDVNVLMVGSSTNVKGGMTTLVQSFLQHEFSPPISLTYIVTHSEKGRISNSFFFAKSLAGIVFHLAARKTDIVHLHMSDKGSFFRKYIVFKISKWFGKKVIVHMHGGDFEAFYSRMPRQVQFLIHDMLKNADKVIALGNNWETTLREIEPLADLVVLMNSVPIPEYKEKKNSNAVFKILFLAVLNRSKGILDLIRVSVSVIEKAEEQKKRILFEIAGDGPSYEEAQKLVSQYQLNHYFHFHGWVDKEEKEQLLQQSDLFILPSYFEGLPMSILEAISYGMPVIATNVGSIDEAVKDGVNGYLIEAGDINALEDCLHSAINDPSFEKMGKASRNLAQNKFDEEKYFRQIEALYLAEAQKDSFSKSEKASEEKRIWKRNTSRFL